MECEILFRGKRVDNGEWTEGYFCECPCDDGTDIPSILRIENKGNDRIIMQYPIIAETVGQFTGLTDKNGVRIFEGDIVNVKTISGSFINYVITWFNSDLCWVMQSLKDTSVRFRLRICWEFEVVDNIHDNPELLKGEELKNGQD